MSLPDGFILGLTRSQAEYIFIAITEQQMRSTDAEPDKEWVQLVEKFEPLLLSGDPEVIA